MTDYYAVLGVDENSDSAEINKAYRRLALKWHPDRNDSKEAAHEFNKVAEAFETLSNSSKRKKYDQRKQKRRTGVDSSAGAAGAAVLRFTSDNANDVFEKIFGKTNIENIIKHASATDSPNVIRYNKPKLKPVSQSPTQEQFATHPKIQIPIPKTPPSHNTEPVIEPGKPIACSLEDLYAGKRRIVKLEGYTKMVIVEIPAGCGDGYQLPVKNPENGDITYFTVHVQKHPVYWRTKDNLHMNYDLSLEELVNGFTVTVTQLNGKKKRISHNYGGKVVGPDLVMKVPKLGMPKYGQEEYGDLYVHFRVKLPERL